MQRVTENLKLSSESLNLNELLEVRETTDLWHLKEILLCFFLVKETPLKILVKVGDSK